MLRAIGLTTCAVSAIVTMSATNAHAERLPSAVSSQLQIATGPSQVASLAIANLRLSAPIMENAAALGIATPAQVIGMAATPEVPPTVIAQLLSSASLIVPLQADVAVASAAELCAVYHGEAQRDIATAFATAAVDGVEASGASYKVVASEAAEILSTLQGWCTEFPLGIAEAVAAATDNPDDTAEELQAAADGVRDIEDTTPVNLTELQNTILDDLPSEAQNNPSPN
jgi:hypothetical protein